ncbi:hypothetical protein J6590_029917 [Homalodisca vitripennis]|nr:hypothetical protein J6590_029917 [Homalodisca vitripennis]
MTGVILDCHLLYWEQIPFETSKPPSKSEKKRREHRGEKPCRKGGTGVPTVVGPFVSDNTVK